MASTKVAPARLGRGTKRIAFGFVAVLLGGLLGAAGASVGEPGQSGFGGAVALLGAGLIAAGFWSRLFSALEMRLIEIEAWMKRDAAPDSTATTTPPERSREPPPSKPRPPPAAAAM